CSANYRCSSPYVSRPMAANRVWFPSHRAMLPRHSAVSHARWLKVSKGKPAKGRVYLSAIEGIAAGVMWIATSVAKRRQPFHKSILQEAGGEFVISLT